MAYELFTIRGKLEWAKVYTPDEYMGKSFWKITIVPEDKTVFKEYKAKGGQSKPKLNTDTGEMSLTFRRETEKLMNGKTVFFSPPKINGAFTIRYQDETGKDVFSYEDRAKRPLRVGETQLIGNGSVGEVTVMLYDVKTQEGIKRGTRLESINIIDLVEYEKEKETEKDAPKPAGSPW